MLHGYIDHRRRRSLAEDDRGTMRVGLGAVNPFTRHPLVLAMTGSGLDEVLPERIVMAIGTGMPLRLAQMGIPYSPAEGVARISETIDQLRTLWAGERIPSATPGMPPIRPMFPPVHRIPLYVAGYRKELVELAGQKADGYLSRPCESIPSLRGIMDRLRSSAAAAGRDPGEIESRPASRARRVQRMTSSMSPRPASPSPIRRASIRMSLLGSAHRP